MNGTPVNLMDPWGMYFNVWYWLEKHLAPLAVAGGELVAGGALIYAGAVATVATVGILTPVTAPVIAAGVLLVMESATTYQNYFNFIFDEFGIDIHLPTLSDYFPELFPRYPEYHEDPLYQWKPIKDDLEKPCP